MSALGRPSKWAAYRSEIVRMYGEGMSRGQIAQTLNTSVQTITRQLLAADVQLEARLGDRAFVQRSPEEQARINAKISEARKGKGTGRRVQRERVNCEECGTDFEVIPGRTGKRFCSKTCRTSFVARANRAEALVRYSEAPRKCSCGELIPYEYRHTRQFCSPECRFKHQPKRQPDPAKQITFNCGTCGKEVTRWKGYGSTVSGKRFCDNTCAAKHTKTVRHYVVREMDMVLDSGWEMLFAGLCHWHKLEVVRVDRTLAVTTESGSVYAPDFIVGNSIAVEVKGLDRGNQDEGRELWRKTVGPLAVVDRQVMALLMASDSAEEMLDTLGTLDTDPVTEARSTRRSGFSSTRA